LEPGIGAIFCLIGVAIWYLGNKIVYIFFYWLLDFLFGGRLNPHNSGLIVKQAESYENAVMSFFLLAFAGLWFVIARKLRSLKLKYTSMKAKASNNNQEITLISSESQ